MIKQATLGIMHNPTNPPHARAIFVMIDGKIAARVTLEEFDRVSKALEEMRKASGEDHA